MAGGSADVTVLPDSLDIQQVMHVQRAVIDALHASSRLELDGRQVRRTDAAGVQLLVAAALEARRRGVPFSLAPSPAIAEAARVLGLEDVLGLSAGKA